MATTVFPAPGTVGSIQWNIYTSTATASSSGTTVTLSGETIDLGLIGSTPAVVSGTGQFANNTVISSAAYINTYTVSFNGTNQYLLAPSTGTNAAFTFAGNFTVEGWFYPTLITGSDHAIFCLGTETTNRYVWYISNGGGITSNLYGFGSRTYAVSTPVNTWTHIAIVRSGSTVSVYVNGVVSSTTDTQAGTIGNGSIKIGSDSSGVANFAGYISNFRIVSGVAVYSNTFTLPTTALAATQSANANGNPSSAITGTQTSILTCQSSTIIDNGTANAGVGFTISNPNTSTTIVGTVPGNTFTVNIAPTVALSSASITISESAINGITDSRAAGKASRINTVRLVPLTSRAYVGVNFGTITPMQKQIEVIRAGASPNNILVGKASRINTVRLVPLTSRAYVGVNFGTITPMQKQIEIIRADKNILVAGKASSTITVRSAVPKISADIVTKLNIPKIDTEVFYTPAAGNTKVITPVRLVPLTGSAYVGVNFGNVTTLQKQIEVIRSTTPKISADIITKLNVPKVATEVFYTPFMSSMQKQIEVVRADRSTLATGKASSINTVRSDVSVRNTGKMTSIQNVRSVVSRINADIVTKLNVPKVATEVFYTPFMSSMQKQIESMRADRTILATGNTKVITPVRLVPLTSRAYVGVNFGNVTTLQKQIEVIRSAVPKVSADIVTKLNVPKIATEVFYTPAAGNTKVITSVRLIPLTSRAYIGVNFGNVTTLQKQIEVIRADRTIIATGKASSITLVRSTTPKISADVITKLRLPNSNSSVFYAPITGKASSAVSLRSDGSSIISNTLENFNNAGLVTAPYLTGSVTNISNIIPVTGASSYYTTDIINWIIFDNTFIKSTPANINIATYYFNNTVATTLFPAGSTIYVYNYNSNYLRAFTVLSISSNSITFTDPGDLPPTSGTYIVGSSYKATIAFSSAQTNTPYSSGSYVSVTDTLNVTSVISVSSSGISSMTFNTTNLSYIGYLANSTVLSLASASVPVYPTLKVSVSGPPTTPRERLFYSLMSPGKLAPLSAVFGTGISSSYNTISSGQLQKQIEIIKNPSPTDVLIFDVFNLQKQIEVIRADKNILVAGKASSTITVRSAVPKVSADIVTKLNVPKIATEVFYTPFMSSMQKKIESMRADRTILATGNTKVITPVRLVPLTGSAYKGVNFGNVTPLQKQIEVIRADKNILVAGKASSTITVRSAVPKISADIVTKLNIPKIDTEVFYTPFMSSMQKQIESMRADRTILATGNTKVITPVRLVPLTGSAYKGVNFGNVTPLQKQIEVIRSAVPKISADIITKLNVPKVATEVFYTPAAGNTKVITSVRLIPLTSRAYIGVNFGNVTTLQKQIEIIKNPSPTDVLIFDVFNLQKQIEVIRADKNILVAGKASSTITVRSAVPKVSADIVTKLNVPKIATEVFYTPAAGNTKVITSVRLIPLTSRAYIGVNFGNVTTLQKQIEVIRSTTPKISADIITKLNIPKIDTQVFYAPSTGKTSTVATRLVSDKNTLATGKASSINLVREIPGSDYVFDANSLQKQIEIIKSVTSVISSNSLTRLKFPAIFSKVFYTPTGGNTRSVTTVRLVPLTSRAYVGVNFGTVTPLQKQIAVIKNPTPKDSIVFNMNNIQKQLPSLGTVYTSSALGNLLKLKFSAIISEVFYAPNLGKSSVINRLKADRSVIAAGKMLSIQNLRSVVPKVSADVITKLSVPKIDTQVFYTPFMSSMQKQIESMRADRTILATGKASTVNKLRDFVNITLTGKLSTVTSLKSDKTTLPTYRMETYDNIGLTTDPFLSGIVSIPDFISVVGRSVEYTSDVILYYLYDQNTITSIPINTPLVTLYIDSGAIASSVFPAGSVIRVVDTQVSYDTSFTVISSDANSVTFADPGTLPSISTMYVSANGFNAIISFTSLQTHPPYGTGSYVLVKIDGQSASLRVLSGTSSSITVNVSGNSFIGNGSIVDLANDSLTVWPQTFVNPSPNYPNPRQRLIYQLMVSGSRLNQFFADNTPKGLITPQPAIEKRFFKIAGVNKKSNMTAVQGLINKFTIGAPPRRLGEVFDVAYVPKVPIQFWN